MLFALTAFTVLNGAALFFTKAGFMRDPEIVAENSKLGIGLILYVCVSLVTVVVWGYYVLVPAFLSL